MANILLVYPAPDELKDRRFGFSLHLLYLASILKQAGHRIINYLDYSIEPFDSNKFHKNVEKSDAVILELDSFPLKRAVNIEHGEKLARIIKKTHGSRTKEGKIVVLSGSDISIFPGERPDADYTLPENAGSSIPQVIAALVQGKEAPAPRPLENLDQLPFPDRSLLSSEAEQGGVVDTKPHLLKSTLVRTSRGCRNNCIFCQRKAWHQKYQAHSIPYVLREFSELKKHHYKNIWVTDDNFTYDLKRAKSLLEELADQELTVAMKIALSSWTRIDEEFLNMARKAHVSIISFGVESANPEILKFYRKKIQLESFKELIRFADSIGLYTVGNFIIGAPMETEETIAETFDYVQGTLFDQVNIKILDYMAGSELYEQLPPEKRGTSRHVFACKENGLNNFPLKVLKKKINRFMDKFNESRRLQLKQKITQNGSPYYTSREVEDYKGKRTSGLSPKSFSQR